MSEPTSGPNVSVPVPPLCPIRPVSTSHCTVSSAKPGWCITPSASALGNAGVPQRDSQPVQMITMDSSGIRPYRRSQASRSATVTS